MTIKHLYPVVEPSLNLDFANSKKLDPRITFTRGSIGTYVGDDGLIKTAAQNEARFDHDSDGNSLGLLVEESRTNLFLRSEEFDQSPWITVRSSISPNVATAPDGTFTADKIVEDLLSFSKLIQQPVNGTGGTTYLFSAYAKQSERSQVGLRFTSSAGILPQNDISIIYSLVDGSEVLKQGTITSFPSVLVGDGWYRFAAAVTLNNTGAFNAMLLPAVAGSINYTGDGTSGIYLWGAQLETGSFPTSYIPTSGSTVTRAADVASITGSNFSSWYNQSEGSLFSQYIPTAGYGRIKFWNGNGNNLNYWSTGPTSTASGVFGFSTRSNQGSTTSNGYRGRIEDSTNYGYVIKHAAAIADNDFACYTSSSSGDVDLNTGSPGPAIGEYLTPLVDRLILTDNLTGVIRLSRLTYYPQRLPNATLQALTL